MSFRCVVGGGRAARVARATQLATERGVPVVEGPRVSRWPFVRDLTAGIGTTPSTVVLADLQLAFPAGQRPGTRLVLTQSTYQLQRWLDWLDRHPGVAVVAHASRRLTRLAPEMSSGRGPWSRIELVWLEGDEEGDPALPPLARAFASGSVDERLAEATRARDAAPAEAALHLAVASALVEQDDLPRAQAALDAATAAAPDWEAAWFEYGKLWLRGDDLSRAAERFAEAARLMPSFASALVNLGAALGEIDRPEEAIAALLQVLRHDPGHHSALNNLAVIYREQGRLDESVAASRDVVRLAPAFVFGHYNLAHSLFLQGEFAAARDAYEQGQLRDPQKNVVQASRLAIARAAAGDPVRAGRELRAAAAALTGDSRQRLLEEVEETLDALAAARPSEGVTALLHLTRELVRE